MLSFSLLPLALLAGTTLCNPLPPALAIENRTFKRQDNCTQYASVAAGSVCYHTPSDCTATYLVQSGDTCTAIAEKFQNFTLSQFYSWNPDVGQTCLGLRAYVPVCVSTPWYTFTPPIQPSTGTVVPASALPVPIMPSIVPNCTSFELAGDGYRVDQIVAQNNITLERFFDWNAYINRTEPVAWAGYWVCVGT